MKGDDRARFCSSCQKHVYNIAGMPAADALALIQQHDGNLCARLYRRFDGTVLTGDCPVGLRAVYRRTRQLVAALTVTLVIGAGSLIAPSLVQARSSSRSTGGPVVQRAVQLWDEILVWSGLRRRSVVAGFCAIPVPPAVPNSPTGATGSGAEME
jgi:hypothetical protein